MNVTQRYVLLVTTVVLVGCGRGPQRYEVTGSVTFDGVPVPAGRLVFTPDNKAGNPGPQGVARIEAGSIETLEDRRVIGGSHWVQILAFDGQAYEDGEGLQTQGRPLCGVVQAPVELPLGHAQLSIEVVQGPQEATATIDVVD